MVMWEDGDLGDDWVTLFPLATYIAQVVYTASLAKALRLTIVNVEL